MNRALLLTLIGMSACAASTADTFIERLSPEEFEAAGLDKLTPEELDRLESLLEQHRSAAAEDRASQPPAASQPEREDLMGKEQLAVDTKKAPKRIESRLIGTFDGWYGETVFELENGQVWQQRIEERQKYTPSENPTVTVYKSFGGYRMRFEGYNQSCPVKRIE